MTFFKILLNSTGLSTREAARFLDVALDTVKSWSSGRNRCPDGVISEMLELIDKQRRAAEETLSLIREKSADNGLPENIDLFVAESEKEAQERGWPTVSAQLATFRRLIEIAPPDIRKRLVISS